MDKKIVIDASAVLALVKKEKGSEIVEKYLNQSVLSSINYSETIASLAREGKDIKKVNSLLLNIFPNIIEFNLNQAYIAGSINNETKNYGLSLGDRACLSLAIENKYPVLTADKIWKKLNLGVEIILIR